MNEYNFVTFILSGVKAINTSCNVVVSSDGSDSNGIIVEICSQIYVLTAAHGVLEHINGEDVRLKGGSLSLRTHGGVELNWLKILYRNGLTAFTGDNRCWDCALIEIDKVSGTSPAKGSDSRSFLNMYVQNVALIGETRHFVAGTVIAESKDFAFLPAFVKSGACGCGLYDDSGFVVGIIVQSTVDKNRGVMIEEGIYSVQTLGSLFVRSLVDSRHDPVDSTILLFSKIQELLEDNSALGCIDRSEVHDSTSATGRKRPAADNGSFDRSTEKRTVKIVCDGRVTSEFEV